MDYVKWNMTQKEMNTFIKGWNDCEAALDLLIIKQQTKNDKLATDEEERRAHEIEVCQYQARMVLIRAFILRKQRKKIK